MFEFSDDVLGFGKMLDRGEAQADCGVRPNCLFGKNCRSKVEGYERCLERAIDRKYAPQPGQRSSEGQNPNLIKFVLIGVAVLVVIILIARR